MIRTVRNRPIKSKPSILTDGAGEVSPGNLKSVILSGMFKGEYHTIHHSIRRPVKSIEPYFSIDDFMNYLKINV